jgi:hypothetical protein
MAGMHILLTAWATLLPLPDGDQMSRPTKVSVEVGCEIRASRNDAGTRLDAVISATGAVAGKYSFRVDPRGGGEPLISETSEFAIDSATPTEVKKAGVDLPAGEGYDASLSIEWPDGMSSCSASAS